jgi:hypothetical protein
MQNNTNVESIQLKNIPTEETVENWEDLYEDPQEERKVPTKVTTICRSHCRFSSDCIGDSMAIL